VISLDRNRAEQSDFTVSCEEALPARLRVAFWCAAVGIGLLQVWAYRNAVSPDGISYIEMAEYAARGYGHALVNGYWSPLYPFLLSLAFRTFHPPIQWEFTVVHALNFAIFIFSFGCFEFFLRELLVARAVEQTREELQPFSSGLLWVLGCLLFFWASWVWLTPAMTTPDMIVAALVYLATALLLRISRGYGTTLVFVLLGAVLGIAYLAKAPMLLVSLIFLVSGLVLYARTTKLRGKAITQALLAFVVFAGISAPLIVALSAHKHRFTFGDAGRINYAEYVDHAPLFAHWQGEPAGTGTPAHPTRKILSGPTMYEFAQPIPGSYPPWYAPSYWYEGLHAHFTLSGQLHVLLRVANDYLKLVSRTGALWVMFAVLAVLVTKAGRWQFNCRGLWWVWLPSIAALGMYALVHVEERMVAGYALVLLVWILSSVRVSVKAEPGLRRRTSAVAILALALAIVWMAARGMGQLAANKPYEPWEVATGLHAMGIPQGAQVGFIGSGAEAYWAHLAQVRIIAEIPTSEVAKFLAVDPTRKQEILGKFVSVGAQAVVTNNAAIAYSTPGWERVGDLQCFVWRPH
jgi:hypothetical protein